jgi:ubiquinone biosynthesis protein
MGTRTERAKRALHVGRVARRGGLLRILRELGVWGSRPATRESAREFRKSLEELGTTYIKLGQLLSSRPDLLPDVYIEELGKLVDDVPPVPFDQIEHVIAAELPADAFARIDPKPVATASIAQIHTALLQSGREVIVKVRRPGIEEQIDLDLTLLRSTAELLERRSERAQLLQARALADELEVHLRGELDFVEEANNTELVARVLEEYDDLVVPRVIGPYVTERVLVLERIEGRKVGADHGLARERARELARSFFRAYVHQVTVEGVYHADPHRGNVLLTTDGRLALVDFGLLGRLDDDTRRNLALLLLAVAQNRADDVADLILGLSRTSLSADEPSFVVELRRKLPRYHWRPLSGIRTGAALAACSASRSSTASACRRASRSSGRRLHRPTRSHASSTLSSTRSSCSRPTRSK